MIIEKIEDLKRSRIKQWPVRSNRASEIGHECIRYLVLHRTRWQEKTLHDVRLQMIFDEGRMHEQAIIRDLMDAGIQIIEQQRAFEWPEYQITGYIDLKIREGKEVPPVEIKSCSPFVFPMLNGIESLTKSKYPYMRRYPAQVTVYLLMDNKDYGYILFKNKTSGELKEIRVDLDYDLGEALLQKAESINRHIAEKTLPDCMPYDEMVCGDCGFIHICLPEIKRDALKFTLDPEMENKITRWFELKDSKSEYTALDKEIKETFKEKEKILVGDYLITGKSSSDNKWLTKIQKLGG